MGKKGDYEKIGDLLILIGGVIGLIQAIVGFITPGWFGIVGSVIALIVSVIVILSIVKKNDPIPYSPIIELILAILLLILGSWIGGIIAIIGAILLFL